MAGCKKDNKERVKIPIYNQYVYIEKGLKNEDYAALVEFDPITLKYNEKLLSLRILAHECIHITNQICKRCLIQLDNYDNDEWYAYLYGEVFSRVYSKIKGDIKC